MADNWEAVSGYDTNDYTDAMIIEMDAGSKRFREISGQALVAGEKNSQYIRFMIPRYWDGIDVSEMNISIVYGLAGKYYGESDAVSVERTDDRLRFGWVVPEEACCIAGTLLFEIIIKNDAYTLKSQIVETIVFKSINIDDIAPEPTREAWYKEFQARVDQALTSAEDILSEAQDVVAEARAYVGAPLVARTADDFEDTDRIYVYTGSEEGYNTGHWYYWRGTAMAWTDGGVYNAAAVDTDTTLSIAGKAADAKEVGDQITDLKEDLNLLNSHDLLKGNHRRTPYTANGTTWHWDGEVCSVSGTASASTVYDLYRNENGFPSWLSAGQTVYIKYSAQVVRFTIYKYVNGTFNTTPIIDTTSYDGLLTIPADATGITIRFRMAKNTTANESVSVIFANYESNEKLQSKSLAIENAKMLSVGNSILTGSVWINGTFNHLSSFANAPYGWIANALGITEQNVDHTLISSAGLMYDAGEGSFLDNILNTDITGYDYILTHLYYQDLTSATSTGIGALDSTPGDGTVAGAVLSLLAYIRTDNPNCRLILVGVPPTGQNGVDIGDEVFSAGYSNGANIMECDYLMHQLAEQEHFIFVDWEDLELSYHWKDFTDNLNIHLNNEDTYRVVGEYLGNQITAQKNEGDSNRVVTRCCQIKWIPNTYINKYGLESASDNYKVSDFIPVFPGETICVKNVAMTTTELIYLTCYDITKSKIADARKESGTAGSIVSEVEEYIVPSTGAYIRVTTASTQVYCHVWHKDKTYIPHPHIEAVTGMIIGENNAYAVEIGHGYFEGEIVNPNNVAVNAGNWANTGIVPLNDTYDYIKLLNVSAGQSCFALFLDNNQNVISSDLSDSNGVLAAERIIKPPVGATYIRCNMLKANKDIFKIYGLKTNLVVRNAVPESANQTFHAMTGNKLHTIFRKTKAIGSLFTISDDDTTSLSNVQKFHTVCMAEGVRGCYAVMTKNTEADSNIVDALREYEKDGFQSVLHCNNQRAIFKPAPDRDIDACREDIAIAIQRMQSYGFSDYRHWISPYGVRDQEMKDLARDFGFDCLITVPTDTYCHFIPQNVYGLYNIPRMELYPTDAESAPGNTLAEIKAQMLDCATNGGWFHLCTHMYQWGDDLTRVTEILQYSKTLGMKNVTISGGLSYWRDIYRLYDLF